MELTPALLEAAPVAEPYTQLGLARNAVRWMASGRGGLAFILAHWRQRLSDGWILLPDHLCWDAILPVLGTVTVKHVPIDDLFVPETAALGKFLADPSMRAIVLVDYFGLCDLRPQIELIRSIRPDMLIAIDAAQAFAALPASLESYVGADVVMSSPRKVLPLPDGGCVLMAGETGPLPPSGADAAERSAFYLAAGALREAVVDGRLDVRAAAVAEPLYVDFFARHSRLVSTAVEAMSAVSWEILRRTDLCAVAARRSANFAWMRQALADGRGGDLIRPALPAASGRAALAFPVRVPAAHRDSLRAFLRTKGFFCPIHWPVPAVMRPILGPAATRLAAELLSLPIDQRYGPEDLESLLDAIECYGQGEP